MKKPLMLLLVFLLLAGMISGCGAPSGQSAAEPVPSSTPVASDPASEATSGSDITATLRIRTWSPELEEDYTGFVIPEFAKRYPNVEVVFDVRPSDQYYTVLKTELQAGEAPELFATHGLKTSDYEQFVAAEVCEDMTSYVKADEFDPILLDVVTVDGKLYSTPGQFFQPCFVFYNEGIFAENGLEVPTTLAQLETVCETLKGAGVTPFALPGKSLWSQFWFINCLVTSGAPTWVNEFIDGTVKTDDERVREVYTLYQSFIDKGYFGTEYLSMDDNGLLPAFSAGNAGMYAGGAWELPAFLELEGVDVGVFAMPGEDKPYMLSSPHPVNGYCVYTESANKELAIELAELINSLEMCQYSADHTQIGNVPGMVGIQPGHEKLKGLLNNVVIMDQFVNYYQFRAKEGFDGMNDYVALTQEYLFGQIGVEELIENIDAEID